ncbi:hypothetical protein BJ875DRAFT_369284 [Amylocarpus encephaloides]|uniref:Uncharacterized protein n=1 Tax=Amylocarpus encephaloides TaxID=45428 RepID=A0A9P7YQB0_9HELO|nr:hypothetical protein BJ875DRAFT_369284 [Amylocarpus encephaloides]
MPSISSSYLIPAIVLNPAFILHLINTFVSHCVPPPPTASRSLHPTFEKLGPLPGSTPYLDMHADDQLCWGYTVVMVIVQVLAFGRVQDNRSAKKSAKAAKIERAKKDKSEKAQAERLEVMAKLNEMLGEIDGTAKSPKENIDKANGHANGQRSNGGLSKAVDGASVPESEASMTETSETSEEEMMI